MKLLILLLVNIFATVHCELVSVRIQEGVLVGKTYTLDNNREVKAFLGVPYADPPTGDYRFKDPQKLTPWGGFKMATDQGNVCLQVPYTPGDRYNPIGDEDCLYMNIFTPKLPESNKNQKLMNVFVYIHGGAFLFGTGNEAYPDHLMADNNVVFVSMNHRLGVLGYFATNDPAAPGNYGFKDQVEALKWVKRNIHHFGGNPDKVTIYGCSSGGSSIQYHMISPLSKGLFHRAISSSGTVLLPWALPPNIVQNSVDLAASLNCGGESIQDMMECMRNKPAEEIVDKGYNYGEDGHLTKLPFGPVVEPHHPASFISENPHELLKAGRVNDVPWMIGFVENEGSFIALEMASNQTYINDINKHWNKLAPKIFLYEYHSKSEQDRLSSLIRKKYLKNELLTKQNSKRIFEAAGDRHVWCGSAAATKLYSSVSHKNTFCYKLYYRGAESVSDLYPNTNKKNYGVCHADDLTYIIKYAGGKSKNKNDLDMTKLLISSITAFMENGNPSTAEVEWNPVSRKGNKLNCLVIYSYTYQRMENIENRENNRFWKELDACERSQ